MHYPIDYSSTITFNLLEVWWRWWVSLAELILVSLKQQMRPINIKFHADQKHGVSSPIFYYYTRLQISPLKIPLKPHHFLCHRLLSGSLVAHESRISCHLWGPYWPHQQTGNGLVKQDGDKERIMKNPSAHDLAMWTWHFSGFFACSLHAFSCFIP